MAIEVFHKANTYVDESIRTDAKTGQWLYCVTGYVASFEAWVQAEMAWQKILDEFEVSEFHLTDFMARKGEWNNDWSNIKRNCFMERLCTVASRWTVLGIGCGIAQDAWENGLSEQMQNEWRDPYYFCIYGMLSLIRSYVARIPPKLPLPLFFLFDNRPRFEGIAHKVYREYQQAYDPNEKMFDGIAFGSRKKYKPLQIADLLVGVINRRFEEMTHAIQPDSSKMKKPMDLLFEKDTLLYSIIPKKLKNIWHYR
jgi:hypothetical protein